MIKARYTVVLKSLLDDEHSKEAITKALSTYPLYQIDKVYDLIPTREELNNKLLNHYKYREIGFETVGRFVDELQTTMNEIMPRYNELFKTVVTMAELPSPFDNVDIIETFEEERNGNSSVESSSTSSNKTNSNTSSSGTNTSNSAVEDSNKMVESTTPQGIINIPNKDIDSVNYADKVGWNKSNSESESNSSTEAEETNTTTGEVEGSTASSGSTTETLKHTFTKVGNQGVNTYAHDMTEFRTAIIDVVDMIINDGRIGDLFMMVY